MNGPFTWDPRALQYRDAAGRFVSRAAVRDALDYALDNAERRILFTAEEFRAGEITLAEWRAITAQSLKEIHLYSAAAAKGGWGQMTQADFGRVGQILRGQYQYLENLTTEIVAKVQKLDGRFLVRMKLYAQSGRVTYHAVDEVVQLDAGMTERLNILDAQAEHCGECVDMTALGWVAIDDPDYIAIGNRTCLSFDRCSEAFRVGGE